MKSLTEYLTEAVELDDIKTIPGKNGQLPDSIDALGKEATHRGSLMDYIRNDEFMANMGKVQKDIDRLYGKYPELLDNMDVYVSPGPKITIVYNKPMKNDKDAFMRVALAVDYTIVGARLENALEGDEIAKVIKKFCRK